MKQTMDVVVSTDWLISHIEEPDVVVIDVRPEDQYAEGHIPGARNIDIYPLKILESDPQKISAWAQAVTRAFERAGIAHDSRVVFYEEISGTSAARGVWLMCALGIGEGAMLDGGLSAWTRAGHPVSTDPAAVDPSSLETRLDPDRFATADDILASIASGGATIIDTRGDIEWMQGTIPTARHLEWVNHLKPDGTLRSSDELRGLYDELGLAPAAEAITFCASGYRAAHTWLVLTWLGYANVRNYAPSWGEWGRRADLPVEATR